MSSYDFSGWATKSNIRCSDGRVISPSAFANNDGQVVPLVWNHQHNSADNVLGHALLKEKAPYGTYAYCSFNDSPSAEAARYAVEHGDVVSMSIYANQLKQNGKYVEHGNIREVSLVLAGANPGATIEDVVMHSDGGEDWEAEIYNGMPLNIDNLIDGIQHSEDEDLEYDEEDEEVDEDDVEESETEIEESEEELSHSADKETKSMAEDNKKPESDSDETVADVFNTLSEKQKKAVYAILGSIIEDNTGDKGEEEMAHNVFENDNDTYVSDELAHSAMEAIIADGKRFGSLKESFIQHADEYGIEHIDYLFPNYKDVTDTPTFIKRKDDWVSKVMNGVSRSPFSRLKSTLANITEDEARAKGYIKGKKKKDEVFTLLRRTTDPQTIYKKQKLDRDDIIDITDMDVVAWLKTEMRMMLDEEIARAILVGDGRLTSDEDHISESHVRSIAHDTTDGFYAYNAVVTPEAGESEPHAVIRTAIKARKDYRGSGNPTFWANEDIVSDMLLMEDGVGRCLYESVTSLATKLRVKEIVEVPVMPSDIYGIIVNLADYKVGADKGGAINMFDDFDIDYNQQKYLIETRISGALTVPFSAIVLKKAGTSAPSEPAG